MTPTSSSQNNLPQRESIFKTSTFKHFAIASLLGGALQTAATPARQDLANVSAPCSEKSLATPARVTIVQLQLSANRLKTTICSDDVQRAIDIRIQPNRIQILTQRWLSGLERRQEVRRIGRSLSDILIDPAIEQLPPNETIVFIPDPALQNIPYSALFLPLSKQRMIERFAIAVTHPESPTKGLHKHEGPYSFRSILALADPSATNPRLRGASIEARSVSEHYERAIFLTGELSSRENLEKAARDFDVIHLASHTTIRSPNRPDAIQLQGPSQDPSRETLKIGQGLTNLDHEAISSLNLDSTNLVVLSGCRTGKISTIQNNSETSSSQNSRSLVDSFLRQGIPGVIGSLWNVDDDTTAKLMLEFHMLVAFCNEPAHALRQAQLVSLQQAEQSKRSAYYWAPFQLWINRIDFLISTANPQNGIGANSILRNLTLSMEGLTDTTSRGGARCGFRNRICRKPTVVQAYGGTFNLEDPADLSCTLRYDGYLHFYSTTAVELELGLSRGCLSDRICWAKMNSAYAVLAAVALVRYQDPEIFERATSRRQSNPE